MSDTEARAVVASFAAATSLADVDRIVSVALRESKAKALEDFAENHVLNQTPGRMAEDLLQHAAAIRGGLA